jgi:hypothetical protein
VCGKTSLFFFDWFLLWRDHDFDRVLNVADKELVFRCLREFFWLGTEQYLLGRSTCVEKALGWAGVLIGEQASLLLLLWLESSCMLTKKARTRLLICLVGGCLATKQG